MEEKLRVIIVRKRWWTPPFGKRHDGITLYPFVFIRRGSQPRLLRHELIHVYQIRRDGFWNFYLGYLWRKLVQGVDYWKEPLEIEAYRNDTNKGFLPADLESLVK